MMNSRASNNSLRLFITFDIVWLLISVQSWGQETGCTSGNCVNGQGTYTFSDGTQYVGEYRDGVGHGQGTRTYADGSKYVGEYRDGDFNGQGTYIFPDGTKHIGEYRDNNYNGHGTLTYAGGDKYVGEFRDDKRHGQGTHTFGNGSKWTGDTYVGEAICFATFRFVKRIQFLWYMGSPDR